MPIRLLTFDRDGTGIRLVERPELLRSICTNIETDYNEDIIKEDIRRRLQEQEAAAEKNAIADFVSNYAGFAILSHTWLQGTRNDSEVTYTDWNSHVVSSKRSAGYLKLTNFCRVVATEYSMVLAWIDTICINKESSSELDESIRSMFNWYMYSKVCITYLAKTTKLHDMRKDPWFTRGWTLQELIAPRFIKFYNKDWETVASGSGFYDKTNPHILREIFKATTITEAELSRPMWKIPVSRRMQWAAKRQVTRQEDIAYSLMGIFSVSMSTAYGEGAERAFIRLVKEILNGGTSTVLDLMNYGYGPEYPVSRTLTLRTSSLIAPGPERYLWRAEEDIQWHRPLKPVILTQLGLRVSVLLVPGIAAAQSWGNFTPKGNYYGTTSKIDILAPDNSVTRHSSTYNLLDHTIYDRRNPENRAPRQDVVVFGILNISETQTTITLPAQCYAVLLSITPPPIAGVFSEHFNTHGRCPTLNAIVIELMQHRTLAREIPKSELHDRHGMTLRTMYL